MISFPTISKSSLELLSKLYPDVFSLNDTLTAIEAMQVLKSNIIKRNKRSVTNLSLENFEFGGFRFTYSYTRQNLHFAELPKLNDIYPGLKSKNALTYASFHSSGQGAISTVLIALMQVLQNYNLVTLSRPYFETPLAHKLLVSPKSAASESVLLIDSSSLEPFHVENLSEEIEKYNFVLLDTSLWSWSDPLLQNIIHQIEGKCHLFILRSHLKLDCFGGEYSTLGSVVYLSKDGSSANFEKDVIEQIQLSSSSIGACASLDQLFPFYKEPEFHEITNARIAEIKNSLNRMLPKLTAEINPAKVGHEIPYHRMFFFLELHSDIPELKKHILKFIRLDSGPVALIDSYGFEFPTVLVTHVRQDKSHYHIRINGHTLGSERDDEIIETLKKIIFVANNSARSRE